MNQNKCVYCGAADATTRDHVPPKCLFPDPVRENLITVPACSSCNTGLSKDEEYFRAIVSQLAETENHPASRKLLNDKIVRGFKQRPKLAMKILSTVKPVGLNYKGKHIATVPAYDISNQSYNRVMVKIIKGLLYHETGQIIPPEFSIEWNVLHGPLQLPQPIYGELVKAPDHTIGDGIFEYKTYIRHDDVRSIWIMRFYRGAAYYGVVFL